MDQGDAGAAAAAVMHRESRRRVVALMSGCGALMVMQSASAAQNGPLRRILRYQDTPKGDQRCGGCMHYVASGERGGCKIMPGDDEISPGGWCISWVATPPR